jgi:hypothetical protein
MTGSVLFVARTGQGFVVSTGGGYSSRAQRLAGDKYYNE